MTAQFYAVLNDGKYLILKTVEGRTPFVIGTIYLEEIAEQVCQLLNENEEKMSENTQEKVGKTT